MPLLALYTRWAPVGPLEDNDALVSSVAVLVQASATKTEADDTLTAATAVLVQATLNVTESDDSLSAAAAVLVTATLTATEGADSIISTAAVLVQTTLNATEAGDILSGGGSVVSTGTVAILNVTEANDTLLSVVRSPQIPRQPPYIVGIEWQATDRAWEPRTG